MRILLDTRTFILAATEHWQNLPKRVQRLLLTPETERLLSAVSLAELAIKTAIGKLDMSESRIDRALIDLEIDLLPLDPRHVRQMFALPLHHREPFDRLLIATAIQENTPLLGGDARFPLYKSHGLNVIWK